MKSIDHISLKYSGFDLKILDQTKLPFEETWVNCSSIEAMESAILNLKVRGAPMIGLSSNFFLSLMSKKNDNIDQLYMFSERLKNTRPTAVNLIHYMNEFQKFLKVTKEVDWIESWAIEKWEKDYKASEKMSTYAITLLSEAKNVITHCNTGGLAAASHGTALGVIKKARDVYNKIHVYVDETRPLLQGARLTTWELEKHKVPYTLVCDSMSASLMKEKKIDAVLVGADRIASNGDTANKIGTYSLAVIAKYHNVPFYVVAPESTVDRELKSGDQIPVEQRKPEEVQGYVHPDKTVKWANDCEVYNPAFDVTSSELITAWITEKGVIKKSDIEKGAFL